MTPNITGYNSIEALKPVRDYSNNTKKIDLTSTPNLAYILGALIGDGCVDKPRREYRIQFVVVDESFSNSVKKAMEQIGLHCWRKLYDSKRERRKPFWYMKSTSKMFYNFYYSVDLKSFLDTKDKKIAFTKGFYEAEGSYNVIRRIRPSKVDFYPSINFTNSNIYLLKIVRDFLIQELDLHPTEIKPIKNTICSRFFLCRKKEIIRFLELINPCIKYGEKR